VIVDAVRAGLAARARPDKALDMQAYLKSAMPLYGVPRAGHRELARSLPPLEDFDTWRDTILELWRGAEHREERYVALDLMALPRYRAFRTMAALPLYEELIVTGAWWDLVDDVAVHLVGALFDSARAQATKKKMLAWSRSRDMWKRRASIICQVSRKADTDRELLYACIEGSLSERDFFLRKAIGWALRAYAHVEPEAVKRYVRAHEHELSPLSKREALKNL
jgi:3-methyladenine DNA glycosylase AlkD